MCILFPKIRGAYAYSKQWVRVTEQKDGRETVSHRDSVIYSKITVRGVCLLSCFSRVQLFAALWTVACQAPLCMGFSRQAYWNGLPCSPPGDLPNPEIKPSFLTSTCIGWPGSLPLVPPGKLS